MAIVATSIRTRLTLGGSIDSRIEREFETGAPWKVEPAVIPLWAVSFGNSPFLRYTVRLEA